MVIIIVYFVSIFSFLLESMAIKPQSKSNKNQEDNMPSSFSLLLSRLLWLLLLFILFRYFHFCWNQWLSSHNQNQIKTKKTTCLLLFLFSYHDCYGYYYCLFCFDIFIFVGINGYQATIKIK